MSAEYTRVLRALDEVKMKLTRLEGVTDQIGSSLSQTQFSDYHNVSSDTYRALTSTNPSRVQAAVEQMVAEKVAQGKIVSALQLVARAVDHLNSVALVKTPVSVSGTKVFEFDSTVSITDHGLEETALSGVIGRFDGSARWLTTVSNSQPVNPLLGAVTASKYTAAVEINRYPKRSVVSQLSLTLANTIRVVIDTQLAPAFVVPSSISVLLGVDSAVRNLGLNAEYTITGDLPTFGVASVLDTVELVNNGVRTLGLVFDVPVTPPANRLLNWTVGHESLFFAQNCKLPFEILDGLVLTISYVGGFETYALPGGAVSLASLKVFNLDELSIAKQVDVLADKLAALQLAIPDLDTSWSAGDTIDYIGKGAVTVAGVIFPEIVIPLTIAIGAASAFGYTYDLGNAHDWSGFSKVGLRYITSVVNSYNTVLKSSDISAEDKAVAAHDYVTAVEELSTLDVPDFEDMQEEDEGVGSVYLAVRTTRVRDDVPFIGAALDKAGTAALAGGIPQNYPYTDLHLGHSAIWQVRQNGLYMAQTKATDGGDTRGKFSVFARVGDASLVPFAKFWRGARREEPYQGMSIQRAAGIYNDIMDLADRAEDKVDIALNQSGLSYVDEFLAYDGSLLFKGKKVVSDAQSDAMAASIRDNDPPYSLPGVRLPPFGPNCHTQTNAQIIFDTTSDTEHFSSKHLASYFKAMRLLRPPEFA